MIGKRLKAAREAAGWSLRELEDAIQKLVSAQAIGKYERDEMMPSSSVLLKLAEVLHVSTEFLLSAQDVELAGINFRKSDAAGVKEERAVAARVLDQVERYLQIEDQIPGQDNLWSRPDVRAFDIASVEQAEAAADELRRRWQLGMDPIPVMAELLEEHGIKVVALDLPASVSGSKAMVQRTNKAEVPVIVVNANHNGERQRFTLAHELAHLLLDFAEDVADKKQEQAADRFAGAFLMATDMLIALFGHKRSTISLGELVEVKQFFKVSVADLAIRCYQAGILTQTAFASLSRQINSLNWDGPDTREPHAIDKEIPARLQRLCFRAVVEGIVSEAKAASALGISTRELDRRLAAQGI